MSEALVLPRRGFLRGIGALIAAPAIVRAASLMPIGVFGEEEVAYVPLQFEPGSNTLLPMRMITREAIRLWKNSNEFVAQIDREYAIAGDQIGKQLRIKLPSTKFRI